MILTESDGNLCRHFVGDLPGLVDGPGCADVDVEDHIGYRAEDVLAHHRAAGQTVLQGDIGRIAADLPECPYGCGSVIDLSHACPGACPPLSQLGRHKSLGLACRGENHRTLHHDVAGVALRLLEQLGKHPGVTTALV